MVRSLYKINLICHGDYFLVVKTLQVGPQSTRRAGFNASATVLLYAVITISFLKTLFAMHDNMTTL